MAHLRVDRRDDPIGARAAMQARDAGFVDVEVLADQLAQQPVGRADALVPEQIFDPLDGAQRALGVHGHAGEHPLALGLLAPATVGLVVRARVVELQSVIEPSAGVLVGRRDRVEQPANAVTNKADGVLARRRAKHRRRIDDLLGRPLKQPDVLR
jgi:hypothetical protein